MSRSITRLITPIRPEDEKLYTKLLCREYAHEIYANNWAYITQACRGSGGLGKKYFDGTTLVSIGLHDGHYVLVRPLGENPVAAVQALSREFYQISGKPAYVKHVLPEQADDLKCIGFSDIREYSWSESSPRDDDTFPQPVIELDSIIGTKINEPEHADTRLRLNRFLNNMTERNFFYFHFQDYEPSENEHQKTQARGVISEWANGDREKAAAYENMVEHPPSEGFNYLVSFANRRVGFMVFGRTGNESAGCHANVCNYRNMPGVSEACMVTAFNKLAVQGIRRVNLGGSETEQLHDFKMKFKPHELREAMHMVYLP